MNLAVWPLVCKGQGQREVLHKWEIVACRSIKQFSMCILQIMEVRFSLLEKGGTNMERGKTGINHVVLNWNSRCWYEFMDFNM